VALIRRKRRTHSMVLARIEESILTLRHLQRQGQPGAEVSLNICLEQWQTAWDRLVLEAYAREVLDIQSPDYHG
jgi:hypothetical protein